MVWNGSFLGQCTASHKVDTFKTGNEFECLKHCKSNEDCEWFTFYKSLGLCENLKSCEIIDSEGCSDCLSGHKQCFVQEPVCWVTGKLKLDIQLVTIILFREIQSNKLIVLCEH